MLQAFLTIMLKIFPYYAKFLHIPDYAGIIGWSINKTPFKLPIYHNSIILFDEMFKCFSQTYTGQQRLEQVGSPVPNGSSVGNDCVARPGVWNSLIGSLVMFGHCIKSKESRLHHTEPHC